jgi:colicin import membrane protein
MAREATITQEQLNAAADFIRAGGGKPTARAIRDQLGTGSMATVLKYLQVWQASQVKPAVQDVTLPAPLTRALVDFIGREVAGARAELDAELVTARDNQKELIAESERQAAMIEAQTETIELTHVEKSELSGKVGQMEADLAATRVEATAERQAAEGARTELAKAQLRLEALPRIEAEVNRLRGELEAERQMRTDAEQKAAVLAGKMEYEADLRKKAEVKVIELVKAAEEAVKRAVATAEVLGNERVSVQSSQARLETVLRELDDARKVTTSALDAAKKSGEEAAELRGRLTATKESIITPKKT